MDRADAVQAAERAVLVSNLDDDNPSRPRAQGRVDRHPDVEMRLVDAEWHDVPEGEICKFAIKGPNIMEVHWNRPAAAQVNLAKLDEGGCFFIVDRVKGQIIRGGYNVYPREVEEALCEYPAVAEAAVVGVPDAEYR